MSMEANKKEKVKTFPHPRYCRGSPPFCAHANDAGGKHPYCPSKYVRDTSEIL